METNSEFKKNLFKQLGIAAITVIPLLGGLIFLRSKISTYSKEVVKAQKVANENAKILESLSTLKSQYRNEAENYLSVIENVLPKKDKLINISKRYQNLAASEDLNFGFSFLKEQKPSDSSPGFIEFEITVKSSKMDNIINFIEKLENFRFLTTVKNTKIERKNEKFEAAIEGRVFYQQ